MRIRVKCIDNKGYQKYFNIGEFYEIDTLETIATFNTVARTQNPLIVAYTRNKKNEKIVCYSRRFLCIPTMLFKQIKCI